MTSDKFSRYGAWKTFPAPVAPISDLILDTPRWVIRVNDNWLPYIVGALKVLRQDQTWDTNDQDALYFLRRQFDELIGSIEPDNGDSQVTLPAGTVLSFAGSSVPDGYLPCDGSAVSRDDYADLFTSIGTTYGAGNGTTTFNLPDMRGRTAIGYGQGTGLQNYALGYKAGEEAHQLSYAEMPEHNHVVWFDYASGSGPYELRIQMEYGYGATLGTSAAGSSGYHNNMQPYIAINWIIKA